MFKFKSLKNSEFMNNVTTLVSGKLGVAVISFLLVPLVARLFSPSDYGVVAMLISAVVVAGPVSTLCYELAIILPEKKQTAFSLLHVVLAALFCSAILICAAIAIAKYYSVDNSTIDALGLWIWVLPVFIVMTGINNALESLMVRTKNFSIIAKAWVLRALMLPSSRIGIGYVYGSSIWALIVGYFIGVACRFGVLWGSLNNKTKKEISNISAKNTIKAAKEYKDFPVFNTPARFVRQLSDNIPILMFGYFYAPEIVGYYAMASRLVQMPAESLVNSVRKVYLQKTAEMTINGKRINTIMVKATIGLAVLGIIPFGLLYLYGQGIIVMLLGDTWMTAGTYAEKLAPWFFTMWITMPSSALYIVLRRQQIWLRIQIFVMIVRITAFVVPQYYGATSGDTLEYFVIASALMNIMIIIYSFAAFWHEGANKGGKENG